MRNNVSADFCFRKSVCFQREKEGGNGENLKGAAQTGLNESVPLLPPTLLSSGKRETAGLFTENSDDHGKE